MIGRTSFASQFIIIDHVCRIIRIAEHDSASGVLS